VKRARLIVNPASGMDQAAALLPRINAVLRTIVRELDVTISIDADDAGRAAARAVEEEYDAIYVAGGDGTLNAVLRGIGDGDTPCAAPIGVIPAGTGNDFAKALGLGEDPEAALQHLVEQRVIGVDLGILNGRPFINTSAGGFVADVSEAVTEGLKDAVGKLAYLIGGARALMGAEPFTARLSIIDGDATAVEGTAGELPLQMFVVCNARMIGGGYPIAPMALIDDGLLDVFLVRRMPLMEFVAVLQAIAAGTHQHDDRVLHFRAAAFDLQFDREVRVNTDGELFSASRCEYRIRPRAARFFCGPSPYALVTGSEVIFRGHSA
jgi:diacylglycerol kinase (ATP)